MIDVFHYPEAGTWSYASITGPELTGGGHDLEGSIAAADHALRQHLSSRRHEPVSLRFAQEYIRHLSSRDRSPLVPVREPRSTDASPN